MVVVVQVRGKLSTGEAGAGGHGHFVAAIGLCYGCGSVALSTRVLIFENEQMVKNIAFIFSTGLLGVSGMI